MAKIWAVYEGNEPTIGGPWAHLPTPEAVRLFELRASDFLSDLSSTPRFGDTTRNLTYAGFKHIVVEIDRVEGRKLKWKPGYYRSKVSPGDAFVRLIRQALAEELGEKNIVDLTTTATLDSRGEDALKIRVVLTPNSVGRLKGEAVLNALVALQKRLRELREDRVPIVEYATKAELKQNANS